MPMSNRNACQTLNRTVITVFTFSLFKPNVTDFIENVYSIEHIYLNPRPVLKSFLNQIMREPTTPHMPTTLFLRGRLFTVNFSRNHYIFLLEDDYINLYIQLNL